MITNEGKIYIKRYLAGWVPSIASSIAFGVGGKVEDVDDKQLQFEIDRSDIAITSYDFTTNKLIFKAPLPNDFAGTIYEVALYSQEKNALAGDYGSLLITTFDSDGEEWFQPSTGADSTFNSTNTRLGDDSLRLTAAASTTIRSRLDGIFMDFSGNTSADRFVLAGNYSANVSAVTLRLMTDASNYFSFGYTGGAGYRIVGVPMSNAVLTGSPSWDEINMIEVELTATSGGSATVDFDGLRIQDMDTPNPEYVMVAREVLATPFIKEAGRIQAIEFALDVAV